MRHRARPALPVRAVVVLALTLGAGAGVYTTVSSMQGHGTRGAGTYSAGEPATPTDSQPHPGGTLPGTGGTASAGGPDVNRSAAPTTTRAAAPSRSPARHARSSLTGSRSAGTPSGMPRTGTSASVSQTSPAADRLPPETSLSSDQPTSRSVVLGFDASEPATFECSLDGAAFASCTSAQQYTGLKPGWHTFSVRATDLAGNQDPSPAHLRWKATGTPSPAR